MAMKFWFGKKDVEHNGRSTVSCDVLTIPDQAAGGGSSGSSVFVAPQKGGAAAEPLSLIAQPMFPGGAVSSEAKAPVGTGGEGVADAKKPAVTAPLNVPSEAQSGATLPRVEKVAEVKAQVPGGLLLVAVPGRGVASAAEAAKTPLRPLGPPVRLAAVPAAPAVAAAPAPKGMAADSAGQVLRPAFALRPKGNAPMAAPVALAVGAPVAAPPSAKKDADRPELNDAAIRPKTDQRALYYELMNGLYDAVLILDDQGHVVDSNTRVVEALGYTREEMWDLPIDKVITGMTSQMFEHLRRNLAENHHILMDARCFRQDGTSFAGEIGVSTLSLTRGSNIVFAIRNVERRKSAMEEMRKGQLALQIALAPSFVCDTDGFFLITNQALLEAFGIPDEKQAKSVRFVDLLPDAARFFLRASCGEKVRETLRVPTPDGQPVKIELALSPVQSGQNITAVAGSILQV